MAIYHIFKRGSHHVGYRNEEIGGTTIHYILKSPYKQTELSEELYAKIAKKINPTSAGHKQPSLEVIAVDKGKQIKIGIILLHSLQEILPRIYALFSTDKSSDSISSASSL